MNHYNELPYVVVNNNGVDVKVYDVDLEKYVVNKCSSNNVSYLSLDGKYEGRIKSRLYAQYSGLVTRTSTAKSSVKQKPFYYGCTLDERFDTFDKWVEWSENQVGFMCVDEDNNLYNFDKDILSYPETNKHYSPENCRFIPFKVNTGINGFKKSKHLSTKRDFLNMVFDNYFETLDEDILGKIIEISGHTHGINNFEVTTEDMLSLRSKYGSFFAKIFNWEDAIDVGWFSYTNGEYSYKSNLKVDRRPTAKEALLFRLYSRLSELESVSKDFNIDKIENLGKWWRIDEIESMIESKIVSYRKMVFDVENGNIKLPHYVLTWV